MTERKMPVHEIRAGIERLSGNACLAQQAVTYGLRAPIAMVSGRMDGDPA